MSYFMVTWNLFYILYMEHSYFGVNYKLTTPDGNQGNSTDLQPSPLVTSSQNSNLLGCPQNYLLQALYIYLCVSHKINLNNLPRIRFLP